MRRLLAIVLLAVVGFPVVAPALTLVQNDELKLPACCRRNGAHHCSMPGAATDLHAFGTRCPQYPQSSAAIAHSPATAPLLATLQTFARASAVLFTAAAHPPATRTVSANAPRGPPAARA